ncbi:myocardin-related transcription factor B [Caerostris extrusa]|uniref:Myocardin-related transcription factor B n=1 Tax=Caerostris extrusa TaxID=172846 RepID=A0AAV4SGJ9_CAEEX|nr:myocardin-related transcription factor B [Caerostris extrusa]
MPSTAPAFPNVASPIPSITVDSILLDNLTTIPTSDVTSNQPASMELTPDTIKNLLSSIESESMAPTIVSMDTDAGAKLDLGDLSDSSSTSLSNEHIVQLQQIWIEKLQRDLERSQKQLQQQQQHHIPVVTSSAVMAAKPRSEANYSSNIATKNSAAGVAKASASDEHQRSFVHLVIHEHELNSDSTPQKQSPQRPHPDLTRVDLDLTAVTKPVTSFPGSIMSTQVQDSKSDVLTEDDFPTLTLQVDPSTAQDEFPGQQVFLIAQLLGITDFKPSPTRSNTDPQFQVARPPPNYTEATKQLKIKQHHLTTDGGDGNQRKKHKSSIKSQAVDDVLEILINNGGTVSEECRPEPITPVTTVTNHRINLTASLLANLRSRTLLLQAPQHASFYLTPTSASDLQLAASLSPSSTSRPLLSNSLDFDFPLDIATMELEGLDERSPGHLLSGPGLSLSLGQDVKSHGHVMTKSSTDLTSQLLTWRRTADITTG